MNHHATGSIAVFCPECQGFELASTRDAMSRMDWVWVGKMLAKGWQSKSVTREDILKMPFGCQCKPKRKVLPSQYA